MTSNYTNTKLTENEVIDLLKSFLEQNGWEIKCYCKGQQHGYDIFAEKDGQTLVVEAKGAKAADNSPTKKRAYFSNTQIEVHFGKAIIQILKIKQKCPNAIVAIAHPDDKDIRKLEYIVPYLNQLGIIHYWVSSNGEVEENSCS